MQILGNAVIRDRYQVVVVCAGIGGLTATALLAKRGIQVLLIEQHTKGWSMIRATSLHLPHLAPVAVLTWRIAGGGGDDRDVG